MNFEKEKGFIDVVGGFGAGLGGAIFSVFFWLSLGD